MKKQLLKYLGIILIVVIFGIIVIPEILEKMRSDEVVEGDRLNIVGSDDRLEFVMLNGEKRRVPEFAFLNQDSILVTQADYYGKVYVVDFFFTTCPTICPIMTENLVTVQEHFRDAVGFGIASFTINPRYDTPIVLKQYAERYGITDLDWHLLTGDQEAIYDLANAGFNIYAAEAPGVAGGFEHSGLFALIDKNGYIRSRKDPFGNPIVYYRGTITEAEGQNEDGESEQISILKEDIEKLLAE